MEKSVLQFLSKSVSIWDLRMWNFSRSFDAKDYNWFNKMVSELVHTVEKMLPVVTLTTRYCGWIFFLLNTRTNDTSLIEWS